MGKKKNQLPRPQSQDSFTSNGASSNGSGLTKVSASAQYESTKRASDMSKEEERAFQTILQQALIGNNKEKLIDLNLLEVLNAYDENINNFNLSNQSSTKVYRKLLQIQREGPKQPLDERPLEQKYQSCQSVPQSCLSTLNQDLHFDFQGSFAGSKNCQSVSSQMKCSMGGGGGAPTVTKIPRPPPSMMNSQFQTLSNRVQLPQQSNREEEVRKFNEEGGSQFEPVFNQNLSLFDYESQRLCDKASQLSSNYSTLQQPSQEQPDSSRIVLPKLSFNDLIQAQKFESFKKWQPSDRNDQQMMIREECDEGDQSEAEEELKSGDLTAFEDLQDESSLMKYSYRQSSIYEQHTSNIKNVKEEAKVPFNYSNQTTSSKFPKLRLTDAPTPRKSTPDDFVQMSQEYVVAQLDRIQLKESSLDEFRAKLEQVQGDVFLAPSKDSSLEKKPREHAIDSDIKLAEEFQTRKRLQKAWKSLLVIKIHQIHKRHLKRLADNYLRQRLKFRTMMQFKQFAKVIGPEERLVMKAEEFRRARVGGLVLMHWKEQIEMRKERKQKLRSTQLVLRSLVIERVFQNFKRHIFKKKVKKTQAFTAAYIASIRRKNKVFRSLELYYQYKREKQRIQIKLGFFIHDRLKRKAVLGFKKNIQIQLMQRQQLTLARMYKEDHYNTVLKSKSFRILQFYLHHQQQRHQAAQFYNYSLCSRFLNLLHLHQALSQGERAQRQFVENFRQSKVLIQSFKSLQLNCWQEKERFQMIQTFLERIKRRKIFRGFSKFYRNRQRWSIPPSIVFVEAARIMLEQSFGELMEGVWKDFPRQKMTQDPDTGENLMMLNYIGVAKNPRIRQYFFQANQYLALGLVGKYFRNLKSYSFGLRRIRIRRQRKILYSTFHALRKQIIRDSLLRTFFEKKQMISRLKRLEILFDGFKQYKSMRKGMNKKERFLRKKHYQQMLKSNFDSWMKKQRKLETIKRNEEVSEQIYKDRLRTKYLAIWLQKLHKTLKVAHLNKLQVQFMNKFMRKRYMKEWYVLSQKVFYLNQQDKAIVRHQTSSTLVICFQELKKYTEKKQRRRQLEEASKQEYLYWLGKRTFMNLRDGVYNIINQRELFAVLKEDNKNRMVTKVFEFLALYKNFQAEKQLNDRLVTNAIHQIRKRTILSTWQSQLNQNISSRMIFQTLESVFKRHAFDKIMHLLNYQESAVEVLDVKRPQYFLLQALNALKRHKNKSKELRLNSIIQAAKTELSMQRIPLKAWHKAYRERRKIYMSYAFTVVQIKNKILEGLLKDWKAYIRYRLIKKDSRVNRVKRLKRKLFKEMKVLYLKGQQKLASYEYIKVTRFKTVIGQVLKEWQSRYEVKSQRKLKLSFWREQKLREYFKAICTYSASKRLYKQEISVKKGQLNQKVKGLQLRRFSKLIKDSILGKQLEQRAKEFNQQRMFQQANLAWFNFYKSNISLIRKQLRVEGTLKENTQRRFLTKWVIRSLPKLQKIQALHKMCKVRNKKQLKKRVHRWFQETLFLVSLDERVDHFKKQIQIKRATSAVQKMNSFSKERNLDRDRNKEVRTFYCKKIEQKALYSLIEHVNNQETKQSLYNSLALHYQKQRKYKILNFLKKYTLQGLSINLAEDQLRANQVVRQGKIFFEKIKKQKIFREQEDMLLKHAQFFRCNNIMTRALKVLYLHTLQRLQSKIQNKKASELFKRRTFKKTYTRIVVFKIMSKALKEKRLHLMAAIKAIDDEAKVMKTLNAFMTFFKQQKQERECQGRYLTMLKTRRLFDAIKIYKLTRKGRQLQFKNVSSLHERNTKSKFLNLWLEEWGRLSKVNIWEKRANLELKFKVFSGLKQEYQKQKRGFFIRKQKEIKLKANSLIGLCQYVLQQKQKRILEEKASQYVSYNLKVQAFEMMHKYKVQRQKVKIGIINQNRSLAERTLYGLQMIVQRNKQVQEAHKLRQINAQVTVLNHWITMFNQRLDAKNALKSFFQSQDTLYAHNLFKRWKKGAYLMKMCEQFYTFLKRDRDEEIKERFFFEWTRLFKHKTNKQSQLHCLTQNHTFHSLRHVLSSWRNQVKGRVLAMKLSRVLEGTYVDGMEAMWQYGQREAELRQKEQLWELGKEKKVVRQSFYKWMICFEQKEQLMMLEENRKRLLLKKGLEALDEYRLNKMQDKYQMLRIIQHFSEHRPENLLHISKSFLHLSANYSDEGSRVCSSSLAKYAIEKWKNILDVLQVENHQRKESLRFNQKRVFGKFFVLWREAQTIVVGKEKLKESVLLFDN